MRDTTEHLLHSSNRAMQAALGIYSNSTFWDDEEDEEETASFPGQEDDGGGAGSIRETGCPAKGKSRQTSGQGDEEKHA